MFYGVRVWVLGTYEDICGYDPKTGESNGNEHGTQNESGHSRENSLCCLRHCHVRVHVPLTRQQHFTTDLNPKPLVNKGFPKLGIPSWGPVVRINSFLGFNIGGPSVLGHYHVRVLEACW